MRIGLSTGAFFGRMETEESVRQMQVLGIPCCEVFLVTFSEYNRQFGRIVRQQLGDIQALSVHVKTQHYEMDLNSPSPRQREDAFGSLNRAMDAAAEFGAKIYVFHGPNSARGKVINLGPWAESIQRAREICRQRGIELCWENVSWCALNAPERVREILKIWPDMGFVLDVKQALETGHDPCDYLAEMGRGLRHVHVLDYDSHGRHVLPGQGCYPFEKLGAALDALDYTGDIILEPYGHMTEDSLELRRSFAYLESIFCKTDRRSERR